MKRTSLALVILAVLGGNALAADQDWYGPPDDSARLAAISTAIILDVIFLLGFAAVWSNTAGRRAKAPVERFSIAAAEQLARRIRLGRAASLVGLVIAVAGARPLGPTAVVALGFGSPILAAMTLITATSWWSARRALRLLGVQGAYVTVQHDQIEVTAGAQHAILSAPLRLVRHARGHALPTATL